MNSTINFIEGEKRDNNESIAYVNLLVSLERIIFNLTERNLDSSIDKIMKLFDINHPYSYNFIIGSLVYFAYFSTPNKSYDLYLKFLESIQLREEEMNKNIFKILKIFINYISDIESQEAYFLIEQMKVRNLIDNDNIHDNMIKKLFICPNKQSIHNISLCFAHYMSNKEISESIKANQFSKFFSNNEDMLKKNDWELHKKLIEEGINPNKMTKIIRNDELEKLQEISSQDDFDFNQKIEPSLYERCSFINVKNVSLIDYAAFFGSIKCFKYLLMNGAKIENTGKYAVAGGNLEIIHLCEQNHSTFEEACKIAIEFHRNDIFKYIYENKTEKTEEKIDVLEYLCITYGNYEILFLLEEQMRISESIITETAKLGNLYLIKYFFHKYQIPNNILVFAVESGNIELVKYILEQKGIDVNAMGNHFLYLIFILIILGFKILFGIYSYLLE